MNPLNHDMLGCVAMLPVVRRKTFHSFQPRGWPDGFEVEFSYRRPFRGSAEWGFSRGEPPEPARCEIEGILLNGKPVEAWLEQITGGIDREALEAEAMDHCDPA